MLTKLLSKEVQTSRRSLRFSQQAHFDSGARKQSEQRELNKYEEQREVNKEEEKREQSQQAHLYGRAREQSEQRRTTK